MSFIRPLFNAFVDAFSGRLFLPFFLLVVFVSIFFLLDLNPVFFWLCLILHTCFLLGYFAKMLRSYQTEDQFYPSFSWILFWMGGKVLVIILSLFLIHILVTMWYRQAPFEFQNLLVPHWKSLGIFWLYFLLSLPFVYQFITTFSFIQLIQLRSIFRIFFRYFTEFIKLIIQLVFVFSVETITITTLLPFSLKFIPNYHHFGRSVSSILFLFNFPISVWCVCFSFCCLILYFLFVKFSLIGQTFARIHQKERDLYEMEHPPVRPEAMSSFSRHYTFEEPIS